MITTLLNTHKAVNTHASTLYPKIDTFLGTTSKRPKIVLVKSAKCYAKYYVDSRRKKNYTEDELIEYYESISAFYNERNNTVYFPIFVRTGACQFDIPKTYSISVQFLVHEVLHSYQYQNGGYSSFSFLFDEACTELCSYVMTGMIKESDMTSYFEWVKYVWLLCENLGMKKENIVTFAKTYLVSVDKDKAVNDLLLEYIRHNELNIKSKTLHRYMEGYFKNKLVELPGFKLIGDEETTAKIQNELYELFEEHRIV
jgi:hypothetical protein